MGNVYAIFRRELGAAFDSPLAYFVVPAYLLLVGAFSLFLQDLFDAGFASLRTVFFWSSVCLVLLVPGITMRLFAEETRTGSIELLATLPVTEWEMVLGKWLAAVALVVVAVAGTLTYPVTVGMVGDLELGPVLGGYLGLVLLGATFAAIGTATSATTKNQVVALLLALVLCLLPYATGYALERVPAAILPVVQHLSFETHTGNLARGVLDTRSLVFFGSVIWLALQVATWSLERRRLAS